MQLISGDEARREQIRQWFGVAQSHTAPLFWFDQIGDLIGPIVGASMFFLDCGAGEFAVTANHVYRNYLLRKRSDRNLRCQIASMPVDLEALCIETDEGLDIATFRIKSEGAVMVNPQGRVHSRKSAHIHPASDPWPPPPPVVDDLLIITGFPGRGRELASPRDIAADVDCFLLTATSISDRSIKCQYDVKAFTSLGGKGLPLESPELEGLSGGSAWQIPERSSTITLLTFAGMIKEYSRNLGIVEIIRADFWHPSGRIKSFPG